MKINIEEKQSKPMKRSIIYKQKEMIQKIKFNPAIYYEAVQFKYANSYMFKVGQQYQQYPLATNNVNLIQNGLGIYFHMQLIKLTAILFSIISIIQIPIIVYNVLGQGFNNFQSNYMKAFSQTTLGNISAQDNYTILLIQTILDIFITTIILIFILIWRFYSYKIQQKYLHKDDAIDPRKFAIALTGFPQNSNQESIKVWADQFGIVYEVFMVYNYGDKIPLLYQYIKKEQKIKQLQLKQWHQLNWDLRQLKIESNEILYSIKKIQNNQKKLIYTIIMFEYQKDKSNLVELFHKYGLINNITTKLYNSVCCCCLQQTPQMLKFKNNIIKLKYNIIPQPQDIRWQNIYIKWYNSLGRKLLGFLLTIIILFFGAFLVGIANIFSRQSRCDVNRIISLQQAKLGSSNQKMCFCKNQLLQHLTNSQVFSFCKEYIKQIVLDSAIYLGIAFSIVVTNYIITFCIKNLVLYTKPISNSRRIRYNIIWLLIALIINSALLPVLVNAQIFSWRPSQSIIVVLLWLGADLKKNEYYKDFNPGWYFTTVTFFVSFMLLNIVLTWLRVLYAHLWIKWNQYKLHQQEGKILQIEMNRRILSYQYVIQQELTQFLLIYFIALFYSSGMPILLVLAAVYMISKYWSIKIQLLRYSKKINGLNQELNTIIVKIMPVALIFHCLFGIWMYTQRFSFKIYNKISLFNVDQKNENTLIRIIGIGFLFILVCLIICIILLDFVFLTVIKKCLGKVKLIKKEKYIEIRYSESLQLFNKIQSYKWQKNPQYNKLQQAISNWQQFISKYRNKK